MTTTPMAHAQGEAFRQACRDLGLGDTVADALLGKLLSPAVAIDPLAHEAMLRREAEMMRLMNSTGPEKLIHDLRNLLNEVALLKAAADL